MNINKTKYFRLYLFYKVCLVVELDESKTKTRLVIRVSNMRHFLDFGHAHQTVDVF